MTEKFRWTDGAVVVAPGAGAALVTLAGIAGSGHGLYGYWFSKEEAIVNGFQILDGAAVIREIYLGAGENFLHYETPHQIFGGTAAAAMSINVIFAGAPGMQYQAGILWG